MSGCRCLGQYGATSARYECEACGYTFVSNNGTPAECPACRAIEDAPRLKNCPFCGRPAAIRMVRDPGNGYFEFYAHCRTGCGASTRPCEWPPEAASCWNHRTYDRR